MNIYTASVALLWTTALRAVASPRPSSRLMGGTNRCGQTAGQPSTTRLDRDPHRGCADPGTGDPFHPFPHCLPGDRSIDSRPPKCARLAQR